MAIDVSALANLSQGATALSNLVLVSPQAKPGYQPELEPGSTGTNPHPKLMFHYEGENRISFSSEITDHYVEDNTAIQDGIAKHPKKVKVQGFIGEVNTVPPAALEYLKQAADKLTTIGIYQPELTAAAIEAYNVSLAAYNTGLQVASAAVSAWNSITGEGDTDPVQTLQQKMFMQFEGYYDSDTLFTVDTPWRTYRNMAIESLDAVQDETTKLITSFEITFKQIRFADVTLNQTIPVVVNLRANDFSGAPVDHGFSVPTAGPEFSSGFGSLTA